jgi:hypothetical protein
MNIFQFYFLSFRAGHVHFHKTLLALFSHSPRNQSSSRTRRRNEPLVSLWKLIRGQSFKKNHSINEMQNKTCEDHYISFHNNLPLPIPKLPQTALSNQSKQLGQAACN